MCCCVVCFLGLSRVEWIWCCWPLSLTAEHLAPWGGASFIPTNNRQRESSIPQLLSSIVSFLSSLVVCFHSFHFLSYSFSFINSIAFVWLFSSLCGALAALQPITHKWRKPTKAISLITLLREKWNHSNNSFQIVFIYSFSWAASLLFNQFHSTLSILKEESWWIDERKRRHNGKFTNSSQLIHTPCLFMVQFPL